MRMSLLAMAGALLLVTTAEATTQPFYFHYSSSGVTIPSGGDPHYYLNATAPTASTPIVTSAIGISINQTQPLPVFTSTALSATTLEKLVTVTLNLSANNPMNSCAVISGTLERVTASGTATTIGMAVAKTATLQQGSGGGLVGNTAIPVTFALDVAGRAIPAGDSLRVRTSVTNSCSSNRSVRLAFDGSVSTGSHTRAEFATPDVMVYGPPGQFGLYDGLVSGTATIASGYAQDWGVDKGLSFFYTAVAPSDGTVFTANFFTSESPFFQTSCSTVVTCFNPDAATCTRDDATAGHFSNIRLPDEDGHLFSPTTASPNSCPTPAADRGGSDIADVELVEDNGEHIQFISSHAVAFVPFGANDPAMGRLHKAGGKWGIESLQYPSDLGANCPDGDCAYLTEIEQLPGSRHLVYAQYFRGTEPSDGVIIVTDVAGNLKAWSYEPSLVTDVTGCGLGLQVTAKSVDVDPSSAASCGPSGCSDERFMIHHDNFYGGGTRSSTFQEYRYDTTHDPPVLEPVTPALFVKSPTGFSPQVNSAPCGIGKPAQTRQGVGGSYDSQGNLWVNRANSLVDVFLKDPTTGKRRLETDSACKWTGHEHEWGVTCPADLEFPGSEHMAGFVDDPTTGNVLFVGHAGKLLRFAPSTTPLGSPTFVKKTTILNLNQDAMLPSFPYGNQPERGLKKPSYDPERRLVWTPTGMFDGDVPTGPHWLFAIDMPRIMAYP